MEDTEHVREVRGVGRVGRGVGDEVVVVGEHRPRFELPAKISGDGEQAAMQHAQAFLAAKMVRLLVGAGGEKVGAARAELMRGRVGPRRAWLGHGGRIGGTLGVRQLLDCASPLALLHRTAAIKKRQRTGAVQNAGAFATPQSK